MRLRIVVLCLTLAASACVHRPTFMQPAATRRWPQVYLAAQVAADQGRFADADQLLQTFVHDYQGSAEARECGYWRAVFLLDPANKAANTKDALAELDAYLAASPDARHHGEATTLRRLAMQLLALDRALASQSSEARGKARDEEVQKLRDELQATRDELELIKRRLAAPKP